MVSERFCRLDPAWHYLPCQWDFRFNQKAREYFIFFFRAQFDRSLKLARDQKAAAGESGPALDAKVDACRLEFNAYLDELLAHPQKFGRPTILAVDLVRDAILRRAGFDDPYYQIKHHDNEQVIGLLPHVCRDLDQHLAGERLFAVIEGALAGNIFDMGVAATATRMMEKTLSFLHTRDNMPRRPWLVDDFDLLAARMFDEPTHRKAMLFVDNAGADFILGMLPLARYLAQRGTDVVVVANELPTLNDMTLTDMKEVWGEIIAAEPSFAKLPIKLISSGSGAPLLDLSAISPALNREAADVDLIVLEGMGRALESNYSTRFDCDALKIAMVKDPFVADWFDGKLYDVICRFEPAPSR